MAQKPACPRTESGAALAFLAPSREVRVRPTLAPKRVRLGIGGARWRATQLRARLSSSVCDLRRERRRRKRISPRHIRQDLGQGAIAGQLTAEVAVVDAGQQEEARLRAGCDQIIGAALHVCRVFQLASEDRDASHVLEVLGFGPPRGPPRITRG